MENHDIRANENDLFDLCIVGGGTIGCFVANSICKNKRVLLLESNGRGLPITSKTGSNNGYRGETIGRSFGLGGTSKIWSGQLAPYSLLEATDQANNKIWKPISNIVKDNLRAVRRHLKLTKSSFDYLLEGNELGKENLRKEWEGLHPIMSEWLPPQNRNIYKLFANNLKKNNNLTIETAVTNIDLVLDKDKCVRGLTYDAVDHTKRRVFTNSVLICVGAIESTRLLLKFFRQHSIPTNELGKNLSDHISLKIGEMVFLPKGKLDRFFIPRFEGLSMRTLRLAKPRCKKTPAHFFAFVLNYSSSSGFKLLQALIGGKQGSKDFREIIRNTSFAALISLVRYLFVFLVYKKIYVAPYEKVALHVDFEQLSTENNFIKLNRVNGNYHENDMPISWSVNNDELDEIRKISKQFIERWNKKNPNETINYIDNADVGDNRPYDVHHPVGTTRMGYDENSVVTPNLSVRGFKGLHTISSALFPSAGLCNPTLSLFCLAEQFSSSFLEERGETE